MAKAWFSFRNEFEIIENVFEIFEALCLDPIGKRTKDSTLDLNRLLMLGCMHA